jgi:hypothetical protein
LDNFRESDVGASGRGCAAESGRVFAGRQRQPLSATQKGRSGERCGLEY